MTSLLTSRILLLIAFAVASLQSAPTTRQLAQSDPQHDLLDKLTGHWVMRGTIRKQQTTHDIDAQWVPDKEYVQQQGQLVESLLASFAKKFDG